jgi:hypothetical protein
VLREGRLGFCVFPCTALLIDSQDVEAYFAKAIKLLRVYKVNDNEAIFVWHDSAEGVSDTHRAL